MDEALRLKALRRLQILDTAPEKAFDDICVLAAEICGVPTAVIDFIDDRRSWFKAAVGSPLGEIKREDAFCTFTVTSGKLQLVPNALYSRYADHPEVVGGAKIRFYASAPLITDGGQAVGSLCVVSPEPKELSEHQIRTLENLAGLVIQVLEARLKVRAQEQSASILTLLNAISVTANECVNVRDGLRECLRVVRTFFDAPLAHYFEVDPAQEEMIDSGLWDGLENGDWKEIIECTQSLKFTRGFGVCGQAWVEKKPVWRSTSLLSNASQRAKLVADRGYRSLTAFPVILRGEVVGIFEFLHVNDFEPSEDSMRVMAHVGSQVSRLIERAEHTAQTEKQKEFLDAVLENLSDGIVACNARGEVTLFNRATREFHGRDSDSTLGFEELTRHYGLYTADGSRLLTPQEIPLLRAFSGEDVKDAVITISDPAGARRSLSCSGRALIGKDGQKLGAVVAMQDISALQKRESALLEVNRALKAATDAKSHFVANMSHEIRTPLNGIIGMTDLVLATHLDEEQKKYLGMVSSSAESLLCIVGDILDFSKVEAGKLEICNEVFSFNTVLENVHRSQELSAKRKGLGLDWKISGDSNLHFLGDSSRLQQVLMNLISNAIKFTHRGGVFTQLNFRSEGPETTGIRIEVTDTGIGMHADLIPKLFHAFCQADSSTTRQYGGTGLGLSISKQLVHLMGGEIGVQSTEGKGTTFWIDIILPIATKTAPQISSRLSDSSLLKIATQCEGFRVLLAEDNVINTEIAMQMLRKLGVVAKSVANGYEALVELETNTYDLVLMDCQMPEMDGYEATRRLRSQTGFENSKVPVIAMTAHAMKGDREKCLSAGMNDYLSKPFKLNELEAAMVPFLLKIS